MTVGQWSTQESQKTSPYSQLRPCSLFVLLADSPHPLCLAFAFWNISCIVVCLPNKNSSGICVLRCEDMAGDKTDKLPNLMMLMSWWEGTRTNKISVLLGERYPKGQWSLMCQAWLHPPEYIWESNLPDCFEFSALWAFSQWSLSGSNRWPLGKNIVFWLWLFLAKAIVLKRTNEGRLPGRLPW